MSTPKCLITLALLLSTCILSAQDSLWQHVTIRVIPRYLSDKVNVEFDYGQKTQFFSDKRLKNEAGRVVKFNSTADVLNYMSAEGWTLVTAQSTLTSNQQLYWAIIMKRKEEVVSKPEF